MSDRANVRNTRALLDIRAALIEFAATARSALVSMDSDVQRVSTWLEGDRPAHWKHEIRKREDAVNQWKLEIQRKRLIASPEPASTVFEERKLQRAAAKLDAAKERLAATQRWRPVWNKESDNNRAMVRPLADALAVDIPRAVAKLDRMVAALEGYAAIRAPRADGIADETVDTPANEDTAPAPEQKP